MPIRRSPNGAGHTRPQPGRDRPEWAYPKVIDPAVPPLRPERHIPNSIATMRRRLIAALVRMLFSADDKASAAEKFLMQ